MFLSVQTSMASSPPPSPLLLLFILTYFPPFYPSSLLFPSLQFHRGSHSRWNPAAPLALGLRKRWQLPTSTQHCIRAFSNHTVFTGRITTLLHCSTLCVSQTITRATVLYRIIAASIYHCSRDLFHSFRFLCTAGKSLHSLHHPYLPVSVVLSTNRTRVNNTLPYFNP